MSIEISDGILAGYLALSAVLLAIRYTKIYRCPRVMFLLLWLCMYIFLTARLSICNFYGQLSEIQFISVLVLILLAGLSGAIVRTTMEEGQRLDPSFT